MNEIVFREYLAWTDWYVNRKIETGKEIPLKVSMRRAYARDKIISEGEWASDFDLVFGEVDGEYEALLEVDDLPSE